MFWSQVGVGMSVPEFPKAIMIFKVWAGVYVCGGWQLKFIYRYIRGNGHTLWRPCT